MNTIMHFLQMGGYGGYVFTSYGCVFLFLIYQWFLPWRRWRHFLQTERPSS